MDHYSAMSASRVGESADDMDTLTGGSGLWALCVVAIKHRIQLDRAALAHDLALGRRPALTADIVRAARSAGLAAQVLTGASKQQLTQTPVPAILRMQDGQYVILGQRVDQDQACEIIRFEMPQPVQCTLDELVQNWSGEIILMTGTTETPADLSTTQFGIGWFVPILWRHKRTLIHILIASLFVHLFALATPIFMQVVIDKVLVHESVSTLLVISVSLGLLGLFHAILQYLRSYAINHMASRLDVELSSRVFAHLLKVPMAYYEHIAAGQIIARVRETDKIGAFLTGQASTVTLDILFAVVFLLILEAYSPRLTLIVVISIPIYVLVGVLIRPQLRSRTKQRFSKDAQSQQILVECVVGAHTVKTNAIEPLAQTQWDQKRIEFAEQAFHANTLGNLALVSIQYVGTLTTAVILFFGARAAMSGELTIGGLVAFNMIASQIAGPIIRLSQLWQDYQQVQVSVSRLGDIMNLAPEAQHGALLNLPQMRGAISFRNVSFRYSDTTPEVLRDLSLDIPAGQVIGVVGSSGCGKSTLAKLAQRLHLPHQGQILIDGINIATVHPAWIRRQSGVVLQETLLFNRSIHENIAVAAPYMTRERVIEMAQLAGAHEFITKLPRGYDTMIEERGTSLSGGQRQRIAIARALATNPRILILDEATSALDYESEAIIQANLREIIRDRTVIIIAHRLSTVRHCDRIVGMADGRIVEDGTHDELLSRERGVYRHLWRLQSTTGRA
jgi:ATP-binding cassette, subfamily B, bacterial HlyB/CyaB